MQASAQRCSMPSREGKAGAACCIMAQACSPKSAVVAQWSLAGPALPLHSSCYEARINSR